MDLFTGVVFGLTALSAVVAVPKLFRYALHYGYKPDIDIYITDFGDGGKVDWDDVKRAGIKYENSSDRALIMQPAFAVDRSLYYTSKEVNSMYKTGFQGGYHTHITREDSHFVSSVNPGTRPAINLPFQKPEHDFELIVMVYPYIQPSEFGLPRFVDPVDLKRVQKTYTVQVGEA